MVAGETAPEQVLCLQSCKIWAYGGDVSHLLQKQHETVFLVVNHIKCGSRGVAYTYICIRIYIYAHSIYHVYTHLHLFKHICVSQVFYDGLVSVPMSPQRHDMSGNLIIATKCTPGIIWCSHIPNIARVPHTNIARVPHTSNVPLKASAQ